MITKLSAKELFELILQSVDESGWQSLILDTKKPFRLRLFREENKGFDIKAYIWNCTHGGGKARAKDEYRVQITSVVPSISSNEATLLLGWHSGYGVFVARYQSISGDVAYGLSQKAWLRLSDNQKINLIKNDIAYSMAKHLVENRNNHSFN